MARAIRQPFLGYAAGKLFTPAQMEHLRKMSDVLRLISPHPRRQSFNSAHPDLKMDSPDAFFKPRYVSFPEASPKGSMQSGGIHVGRRGITHYFRAYVCMYLYMYACTYVCLYVCIYVPVYACMYLFWMYACMHACMHACMYVCLYVCTYASLYY